ncbi:MULTISPECIES: ATP-binding protein [unclassified Leptolyngbya]|uniref:PAS domain-containing sensor histidine kinase n=1 Tax=unclassified Leptolyngbya TaxID=2650499 RepID=UPI001681EFC5|nr:MULTISPECIES: ATP-binding protein [unclassified Leptolyngbya]MBD1909469.1 PAS domain-containing protein [Leptolyngbya sp. FACHB-8]MBD2153346.1 PAS domain-containing protein [Leptolyngbya sp. FACHB-16]
MIDRNVEDLSTQEFSLVSQEAQQLFASIAETACQRPELVVQCLEKLQSTVEELQVADEELRQQQEALTGVQADLERERQRYRDLFDFAPDGYLITNGYGLIQEANIAAGRLFNMPPDHMVGKPLVSFVYDDHRHAFLSLLNQLPTLHRVQDWQAKLCSRGQTLFDASLTMEMVHPASQNSSSEATPLPIRWLVRDITPQKRAEEQLRQMQLQNLELREVDHLKTQFIAALSHEMITPLSAILGLAQLLQQHFQQKREGRFVSITERIVNNGRSLLTIIEDMLSHSRLQSFRLTLNPEPVDLRDLLLSTVDELRSLADQKALQIHLRLPTEPLVVTNDILRLRQVVVNLLSNAIKFTDTGSICVNLWELPEGRIAIVVSDTGIGIAPEDQLRIFREFWQASQRNSRQNRGAGLGLSICKAIVELMQGSITVESRLGEGAIFRVELPRWLPTETEE